MFLNEGLIILTLLYWEDFTWRMDGLSKIFYEVLMIFIFKTNQKISELKKPLLYNSSRVKVGGVPRKLEDFIRFHFSHSKIYVFPEYFYFL